MWVLILTLSLVPTGGVVIYSVPGFTSADLCKSAADAWVKENDKAVPSSSGGIWPAPRSANAICVRAS
jgi:hypothetical protein